MRKCVVSVLLGVGVVVGVASVQEARAESTGCGLGTMVFEGQSGVAPQVLAVTTNGTSFNQTFGITSGTLGCDSNDVIASAEVRQLTVANLDNLAKDMARGEGETLASLATAMEIEADDQRVLFAAFKSNFTRIFPDENVTAEEVLVAMRNVMSEDEVLARYVAV